MAQLHERQIFTYDLKKTSPTLLPSLIHTLPPKGCSRGISQAGQERDENAISALKTPEYLWVKVQTRQAQIWNARGVRGEGEVDARGIGRGEASIASTIAEKENKMVQRFPKRNEWRINDECSHQKKRKIKST